MPVKRKVYVACEGGDYEGFNVIGVFNKVEKARDAVDKSVGYDYVEIQVFEMNGERLFNDPDEYSKRWGV